MKKKLAIFGAGGLGKEVLSLAMALPEWNVVGFYDDALAKGSDVKHGLTVLGGLSDLGDLSSEIYLILAIGSPSVKKKLAAALQSFPIKYATLVHPAAILQDPLFIKLGAGSIIGAGTVLTTDIVVGPHVLINLNCTIGHDVSIGPNSSIMPGVNISGGTGIGEAVLVGSGATIINRVAIGDGSTIGAGAVVHRPVLARTTVVGVPARSVKPSDR